MKTYTELPTQPLQCWPRIKEMRRELFRRTWKAKETGGVLYIGAGSLTLLNSLPAGLGDVYSLAHGIYFAHLMRHPDEAIRCFEAAEERGFNRDICATLRLSLGQKFTGLYNRAPWGEHVQPDFALEPEMCLAQTKTAEVLAKEHGIPFLVYEVPFVVNLGDQEEIERARNYLVSQMEEVIEGMEKATGRKYSDERLIEAVYNEWRCCVLWARICELQKAIPAPLDDRMLKSLGAALYIAGKHRQETAGLLQMVLEEVEERAKRGISAIGIERCRLFHEGQPPWYFMRLLRYPNSYGAVFIGSRFLFATHGAYVIAEDGSWTPAQTLEERGVELKTREDALGTLADLVLLHSPMIRTPYTPFKIKEHVGLAEDFHIQGVVIHLDMGCRMVSSGHMEARLALQEREIPTLVYDSNSADIRDFTEAQVLDRLDAFLESLELTKLEED